AGQGAAPAGLVATRHPGGSGAPPGTTRSPCQELAEGSADAFARADGTKERPAAGDVRDWRAARRPRAARHELSDLRFAARHPPSCPGRLKRRGEEPACVIKKSLR